MKLGTIFLGILVAITSIGNIYAEDIIVHENGAPHQKNKVLKRVLAIGGGIIVLLVAGGAGFCIYRKCMKCRNSDVGELERCEYQQF